ncbi:hypothetical protein LEP1GSC179_3840 [Leptospira santarosai str. MOR084]|uniref:Uncharacterized protein n=1 Tax=Leptospira santarosai str. MOR084 TaxID=1049984 RepID=A0A0E2BDI3_9LEPT|nr:hypothetical protein LEP1GSC179_3840 [Leptospira santarosai str. MOR084]
MQKFIVHLEWEPFSKEWKRKLKVNTFKQGLRVVSGLVFSG